MDVIKRLKLHAHNMQEVKEKAGRGQVILSAGDKPIQVGVDVSFLLKPGDTMEVFDDNGIKVTVIRQH